MQNMTQKILMARTAGNAAEGDVIFASVDCIMTHDVGTAGVAPLVEQYGLKSFAPNVEFVTILDHFVPACSLSHAKSHVTTREFVKKWKLRNFYEIGRGGICHQVMLEDGFARSGSLVVATDAHVTTYGGVGCLGLGVGVTDVAMILASGKIWLQMPRVIGICLTGELQRPASAKDLALRILQMLPFRELNYSVVEFYGEGVASLSMDERFCLCNMLSEGGVKSCLVACDAKTDAYMKVHARGAYTMVVPDEDAPYDSRYTIALDEIEPMVACPHHPTNGKPLRELERVPIQQAFLGSCTNGRMEDLRIAAELLEGRRVHPEVRLVVTPGSQQIYRAAMEEGLLNVFLSAGALITNPSCGACIGASSLLAAGETCVSTSNRNFRGRMGSVDASIYLASPATVACSAVAGYITGELEGM